MSWRKSFAKSEKFTDKFKPFKTKNKKEMLNRAEFTGDKLPKSGDSAKVELNSWKASDKLSKKDRGKEQKSDHSAVLNPKVKRTDFGSKKTSAWRDSLQKKADVSFKQKPDGEISIDSTSPQTTPEVTDTFTDEFGSDDLEEENILASKKTSSAADEDPSMVGGAAWVDDLLKEIPFTSEEDAVNTILEAAEVAGVDLSYNDARTRFIRWQSWQKRQGSLKKVNNSSKKSEVFNILKKEYPEIDDSVLQNEINIIFENYEDDDRFTEKMEHSEYTDNEIPRDTFDIANEVSWELVDKGLVNKKLAKKLNWQKRQGNLIRKGEMGEELYIKGYVYFPLSERLSDRIEDAVEDQRGGEVAWKKMCAPLIEKYTTKLMSIPEVKKVKPISCDGMSGGENLDLVFEVVSNIPMNEFEWDKKIFKGNFAELGKPIKNSKLDWRQKIAVSEPDVNFKRKPDGTFELRVEHKNPQPETPELPVLNTELPPQPLENQVMASKDCNSKKEWIIKEAKKGNHTYQLIGRECEDTAGIFIEKKLKGLSKVTSKISKSHVIDSEKVDKKGLAWREVINESIWHSKFEKFINE